MIFHTDFLLESMRLGIEGELQAHLPEADLPSPERATFGFVPAGADWPEERPGPLDELLLSITVEPKLIAVSTICTASAVTSGGGSR